jgi:hypothetical protein
MNPRLLSRQGRSGRHRRWVPEKLGPGRQIVSQDSANGVSRFGGQAGTQAPTYAHTRSNPWKQSRSTTHILPADSVRSKIGQSRHAKALQSILFGALFAGRSAVRSVRVVDPVRGKKKVSRS